ncbi:MAG: hypothetical protein JWM99_3208 [Verrucomicrobiales bacterium]|nr:hypothetical protein [Verrucomicrobiales bacterium]
MLTEHTFWEKHPGLVWSNPNAGDEVYIRAALLKPRYLQLLEIALEFGLDRLRHEWKLLKEENTPAAQFAALSVERILRNIGKGFEVASSQN